jgi:uncharacterized Tic20 family protein
MNDEKRIRIWGMLCHLTALLGMTGLPFGHLLGPLLIWLLKRKDHAFIDGQGKESLNFQISMTLYTFCAVLLVMYLNTGIFPILIIVFMNLILVIIASLRANSGETFRYPLNIRILR